jgi:hypothetical protein
MTRTEVIELGLVAPEKRGEAILLTDRRQLLVSAREKLVDVALVPGVPDQLVDGGVEDVVEGDRELGDPQARTEMAPDLRNHIDVAVPGLHDEFM